MVATPNSKMQRVLQVSMVLTLAYVGATFYFGLRAHSLALISEAGHNVSDLLAILGITKQDIFHEGEWKFLEVAAEGDAPPDGLIVYQWRSEKSWKVVAVNLSAETSQGRVRWSGNVFTAPNYIFYDELNNVRYPRDGAELRNIGLFIRRDAFQAHVFDITLAP